MIQTHARNLALQWNLTDFKGGVGWCYRFMKRHGLSMRAKTKISQKMPQEYEEEEEEEEEQSSDDDFQGF
jgi:hypothetical protein